MPVYVITRIADGSEVHRYESLAPIETAEWPFSGYLHTEMSSSGAATGPAAVAPSRKITKLNFVDRMGDAAFKAILEMAKVSIDAEAFVKRFDITSVEPDGSSIDLEDARTIGGLRALEPVLVHQGVVLPGWADEVLNAQ